MKKLSLLRLSAFIFIVSGSLILPAQSVLPDKQVIATFDEGETFVYGESCFTLTADKTTSYFITKKDGKFYVYDNGKRSGPFDKLSDDMLKACNSPINPLCATFNPTDCQKEDIYNKYIVSGDNSMVIKVKDKSYGPYLAIMQFAITCDESRFAALVMKADQTVHLIHSGGKDVPIDGLPQWLLLSADGNQALAAYGKNIDPSKIDMNNFNIAEFTAFHVIDLDGVISGPYDPDQTPSGNFWFCKTGGPHWYLIKGDQLLRDGKAYRKEISGYATCDLWINEDGRHIALVDYGQDTVTETNELWLIKYPLEIMTYQAGGKTWIKWISLENGKSLVAYKKVL